MDDLKIELNAIFDALSHERQQRVVEYIKSMKDGPKGNTARCCGKPLAKCECRGE